jgi:membrane-associated phospholipid phosphatase
MYTAYKKVPPSRRRTILLTVYGVFLVLIPISRIYVADHWMSEVLGGLLLGSVFLAWMILFYEWLEGRSRRHSSGARNKHANEGT